MAEQIQTENKMGVMPVKRLLITMALPMIFSMVVQALYNVVDSIFVSRISEDALTAVSIAFPMQNLLISFATGFGVGINALVSRALGRRDREGAARYAMNGALLEALSYLLFLVIGLFFVESYVRSQTDIEAIVRYGIEYLRIVLIGSFGIFTMITYERFLQSIGKTIYHMYTQLTGAVFNIVFDPILIFGLLGFPKLGVAGAAYATIGGQILGACMGYLFNRLKNNEFRVSLRGFRPDWKAVWDISKISIPSIVMASISSVMTFCMNLILFSFSSTAVAVFGVYYKLQSFVFMPVFGLNNGMVPIIAYNYGAKKPERINMTIRFAMCVAVGIMLMGLALFQLIPRELLLLFDASADMLAIGVPALRIISTHYIFAGACIICSSACQAFGYSVYSLIISAARQLLVMIPVAWLLSLTHGLNYVWLSFPIAECLSIIICVLFLRRVLKKTGMTMPSPRLGAATD